MTRLLEGVPQHTDDRLTISNLAREAGVSRATANRAEAILTEFRSAEARFRKGSISALKARIRELEAELRTARGGEMADLRATARTLAQQVQALTLHSVEQTAAITALQEQLAQVGDPKIVPFRRPPRNRKP
jgi:polyhydroxyalkanoate synthesis regulator phasin